MWTGLLDLLFPRGCCACGARPSPGAFCGTCSSLLEVAPSWRCRICGEAAATPETAAPACPGCDASPPPFERVVAPFVHGGPIATAIHRFKYRGARSLARPLAALLAGPAAAALSGVEAIVPVPLHPSRRRERGYDQTLLLGKELARISRLELLHGALSRVRSTRQQVGLSRTERAANLEGAFEASPGVRGRSLVLLDDVVTTGATAAAAASALRSEGAKRVVVLALARA